MTHLSFRQKLFSAGKRKQPHFPRSSFRHFTRKLFELDARSKPVLLHPPLPTRPHLGIAASAEEGQLNLKGVEKCDGWGRSRAQVAFPPGVAAAGLFCFAFVSRTKEGGRTRDEKKNRETGRGKISPFQTLCSAVADQTDIFPANHAGGRQSLADSHRPVLAARMKVGHERLWPHNAKRSIFPKENIPDFVTQGGRRQARLVCGEVKNGSLISRQAAG